MKISEIITDKYKLRIPPTVYYDLLSDVVEAEEEQEPKTGRWIYDRRRDWDGECKYECSECGMGSDVHFPYCMRCGTKMEVEE